MIASGGILISSNLYTVTTSGRAGSKRRDLELVREGQYTEGKYMYTEPAGRSFSAMLSIVLLKFFWKRKGHHLARSTLEIPLASRLTKNGVFDSSGHTDGEEEGRCVFWLLRLGGIYLEEHLHLFSVGLYVFIDTFGILGMGIRGNV